MKRIVKTTGDNSRTLYIEELDECYHSHHGALQEAEHVFIKNGLEKQDKKEINILEMGFGTGLNVLVTLQKFLQSTDLRINYYSLEKYPISQEEAQNLDYGKLFENPVIKEAYTEIHSCLEESGRSFFIPFLLIIRYSVSSADTVYTPILMP